VSLPRFHSGGWQSREPHADPEAIAQIVASAPVQLPDEYLSLFRAGNGGEGPLALDPEWFRLWRAEDVLALNRDYGVPENVPGLFGFGSNGVGELLAFDMRQGPPWKIVMVPFICMDGEDIKAVAEDFTEFLQAIGRDLRSE
jgi:hypothetical protein